MTATDHHLPYFELSPVQFEELCFWLLEARGHGATEHWGAAGAEKGIDLISFAPDGKRWVTQCKRVRAFGKAEALKEVRKVLKEPPTPAPEVYFLVTTCPISRQVKEALEECIAGALKLETWDLSKLDKRLREHPEVVKRFFGETGKDLAPHWNVPNRNPYFTGREELLEALAARLEAAGEVALTQAITGLGGVGKTQTAIEFAHRHRERYDDGVYWADASSAEALHSSYAGFAVMQSLARLDKPMEEASERFRRRLSAQDGWLLVLDNADAPEQVRELLPKTTTGHMIVTTRVRVPGLGRDPLAVDLLPREQALAFLLERAGRGEDERGLASELAQALGRLPLALEQAGAYLAHHPVTISDYLASFAQRRLELVEQYGPEAGEYQATVASTWEISFRKVEDASAAAAEALHAYAFLAPNAIPLELFVTAGNDLGPALGGLAVSAAADRLVLHEQLVEPLTRYSLVDYQAGDGGFLSIHRLVQEVIRHGLGAGDREDVHRRLHRALDALFPEDPETPGSWQVGALWLPHVMSLLARWREAAGELGFDPTALWIRAAHNAWAAGRADMAAKKRWGTFER